MKVVAFAGGTGSAKLLRGLAQVSRKLTIVANTGDNIWMHGLQICPDIDIAMYSLAGIASSKQGWGIEGDTFSVLDWLSSLGEPTWFRLGDRDLATSLVRTKLMRQGKTLTQVTKHLSMKLGLCQTILPATDSEMATHVLTNEGEMHLQEFWVKHKGRLRPLGVKYVGAGRAEPTKEVRKALEGADRIVLCPANPVTSIGPILAISGMRRLLAESQARKTALSPMIGKSAFSGPASDLMKASGMRPDSVGVAKFFAGLVDSLVIDRTDRSMTKAISAEGVECLLSTTMMKGPDDEKRLAKELLRA